MKKTSGRKLNLFNGINEIRKNASSYAKLDINGNSKSKWNILILRLLPILFSVFLVFVLRKNFSFEPKLVATLLSLFTGLLFGLLLKISDKAILLSEIKTDNVQDEADVMREANYLKLFFYFLSYSILVSICLIIIIIIQSFFSKIMSLNLNGFIFSDEYSLTTIFTFIKVSIIYFFRFLLIYLIYNFLYFILLSMVYLYKYIQFNFSKI